MTSTNVFYGAGSTLTVHMPPGSSEAVLMIEALDNVASITVPIDEVVRLISTLQVGTAGSNNDVDAIGSARVHDATDPLSAPLSDEP